MTEHAHVRGSAPLVSGLALSMLLLASPRVASASIFGEENATLAAILSENIAQLQQMVNTVTRLTTQIAQLKTMISQGDRILSGANDLQGVSRLLSFSQSTLRSLQRIDSDTKRLRFQLDAIDKDREQVFPKLKETPHSEFRAKARVWNDSLRESSKVAMRAQTSVSNLQERLDRVEQLQRDADDTKGVVGQLQIITRSLGVLHADLVAIEANLATGQRVTATMAGVQAAEADRTEEIHKRMLEGYTARGAPPAVLQELP